MVTSLRLLQKSGLQSWLQDSRFRDLREGLLLKKNKRPEKQTLVHNVRVRRWGKTDVRRGKESWIDGKKQLVVTGELESQ